MFKIYYDQEEIIKTKKLQEVDTFQDLVNQKKIVKFERQLKGEIQNHINIADYIPKPAINMMKKLGKGFGSRILGVADNVSTEKLFQQPFAQSEMMLNSPTGSQAQIGSEGNMKEKKVNEDSDSQNEQQIDTRNHTQLIKNIELKLLKKEIVAIIDDKIRTVSPKLSPETSPKNRSIDKSQIS